MRRLGLLLLLLLFASTATAATIRGTKSADLIIGTPGPDRIVAGAGNDLVQVAFGATDSVDCGAGFDVVSADATDRIASNCEVVSRRLSVDPYQNADSQHETAVEPDSAAWGDTVVAVFQVGRRLAGAASNIGTAVSRDDGRTWTRAMLPGLTGNAVPPGPELAASDPSVAYDAAHGVWLVSTLTLEGTNSPHIWISRSTDGAHWSAPVDAADGETLDKEWIACDNGTASPFRGRCYLEYTDDQKSTTTSQFSTDGGLTWSAMVHAGALLGTQPVVQPNGTLVVVAGDYRDEPALSGSMIAYRSTDGGATFARFVVSDLQSSDNAPMRAISLPSVEADANGTIYATWPDCRFRAGCSQNDLVLSTSTDGMTWSAPTRVTSGTDAFIPGLAADPSHPGRLAVVYAHYYGACSRGPCQVGISLVQSRDGGKTWSPAQRLEAQPFSTNWVPRAQLGRMIGDYFSTSYASSRVVPVFALATSPLNGRFRQAIFAASLRPLG